ncbi:MAG: (d)CMP kinase [bacterium]
MDAEKKRKLRIAIDGPAGAGKTTVSKLAAQRLGLEYVDTGAMYRCVALRARRENVDPRDERRLGAIARTMEFEFRIDEESGVNRVFMDGEDVTEAIRGERVSSLASAVSAVSAVRRELVARQKQMAARGGVVMEGRDIGTVVIPYAEVKVFLDASEQERARRRHLELLEKDGAAPPLERILRDIHERDLRDSTREDSPLAPALDAVRLETDGKSIARVVDEIIEIAASKTGSSARPGHDA